MSQYRQGTVSVTNGSNVVNSDIAVWTQNANAGDLFTVIGSNVSYEIASIVSNTQLTLSVPYGGVTASSQAYVIARDFTPNLKLPYIQPGDLETATVLKAQALQLDGLAQLSTTITSPATGQILAYTGSAWVNATLAGSAGEITVSDSGATLTINLPQALNTNSSPTFAGLTLTGGLQFSNSASITAAGTTQGTATVLTADTSVITTCAAGAGVVLPTGIGREVTVINRGANPLLVYPPSGAQIDGASTNAATSVPVNGWLTVNIDSATQYFAIDPVMVGTANQVNVTQSNNGTLTLSLPQSIATTSTPTFSQLVLTNSPTSSTHVATKGYVDTLTFVTGKLLSSFANIQATNSSYDNGPGIQAALNSLNGTGAPLLIDNWYYVATGVVTNGDNRIIGYNSHGVSRLIANANIKLITVNNGNTQSAKIIQGLYIDANTATTSITNPNLVAITLGSSVGQTTHKKSMIYMSSATSFIV